MTRFVLDCSVTLTWFFEDEKGEESDAALNALIAGEALVPAIWPFEVTNSIVVAERRRRCKPADSTGFLALLGGLRIHVEPSPASAARSVLLATAREFGISLYDAAYLELAMRESLPLASNDTRLKRAAEKAGVKAF